MSRRTPVNAVSESPAALAEEAWVRESRFGDWFLTTSIWRDYVVRVAFDDVTRLGSDVPMRGARILDAGCGSGRALPMLDARFQPRALYGVDIDPGMIALAKQEAQACARRAELILARTAALPLPDESLDMVFCHQLLHHLSNQERTLAEIYRVLRPGGALLFCESLKPFIESPKVYLLFRHPGGVQRCPEGYLQLLRNSGFSCEPRRISLPAPWWARPSFGTYDRLRDWLGLPAREHPATQLNVWATRSL